MNPPAWPAFLRRASTLGLCAGLLSSCAGSFEVPPQPKPAVQEQEPEKPRALCLVRARLFRGMVAVPCADLAQEFRP